MFELVARWLAESWGLWLDLVPYLVLGFALAGLLHGFLGEGMVRRHLSQNRFSSILKATLLGIPLPICSCGVIPLAESLRRDGASKGATLAFLVSTPTSGVDSILATYGLMGPFFAVMRPIAGLLAGLGVGALARVADPETTPAEPRSLPVNEAPWKWPNRGQWADMLRYGLVQLPRDTGKWLLLGTLAGGLVTALVPPGFVENHLANPVLQYLSVLLLSIPLYVCATGSIPMALGLMSSGILPGAALAFLIAGPATNTVTLTFILKRLGGRVTLVYLGTIVTVSVLLGVLTDAFFAARGGHPAAHAHHVHPGAPALWTLVLAIGLLAWTVWLMRPFAPLVRFLRARRRGSGPANSVSVPDMTCMVCERKIRDHFSRVPELLGVEVNLPGKKVLFRREEQREAVCGELKKLGYHPGEQAPS
jgi:uncharacterized membrane protein YraQ (UPF0718 family)